MSDIATILLHRGQKFAARGSGLFLKDVMHDGEWVHPITNALIVVTASIRRSIEENMKKWFANSNKVPMPDGHTIDTAANKGFWPGPFAAMGDDVLGLAQPLDPDTIKQMENGTADAVSVSWWSKFVDANKVTYENIFDHVCLTNYPVIGKQRPFVKMKLAGADDWYVSKGVLAQMAVPAEDEGLLRGLESLYKGLRGEKNVNPADLSPDQRIAALLAKSK